MPTRIEVCPVSELQPGERKIVENETLPHSVGVFNIDGEYYALANVCPHHLAPLCEGTVTGKMESDGVGDFQLAQEGEIIRCPWHGWQFNIKDGSSASNPHKLRTRTYDTSVEKPQAEIEDEIEEYGTALKGDDPPVDSYDVDIEEEVVVLYV